MNINLDSYCMMSACWLYEKCQSKTFCLILLTTCIGNGLLLMKTSMNVQKSQTISLSWLRSYLYTMRRQNCYTFIASPNFEYLYILMFHTDYRNPVSSIPSEVVLNSNETEITVNLTIVDDGSPERDTDVLIYGDADTRMYGKYSNLPLCVEFTVTDNDRKCSYG